MSHVLHYSAAHQDLAIAFHNLSVRKTKLGYLIAAMQNSFVVLTSVRICHSFSAYFVLLGIYYILPQFSTVIPDEKQVNRRLFKHPLCSCAARLCYL